MSTQTEHNVVVVRCGDPEALQFRVMSSEAYVMASVRLRPLYECKSLGIVSALETLPNYRRLGCADALLAAVEKHARLLNLAVLRATVWTDNIPSRSLFMKHGYHYLRAWHSPHSGHDVLLFTKVLIRA